MTTPVQIAEARSSMANEDGQLLPLTPTSPPLGNSNDESFWPQDKRVLRVGFLNGTLEERNMVMNIVNEHYNTIKMGIRFQFFVKDGDSTPPDIRVQFSDLSRSMVGSDATSVPSDKPTMELDLGPRAEDGLFSRKRQNLLRRQGRVLHEFGHALGLRHAHSHPDSNINWNYEALCKRSGWDHERVMRDWGETMTGISAQVPYDPDSIMHYEISRGDTHSMMTRLKKARALSKGDRRFLMAIYPFNGSETTPEGVIERMSNNSSEWWRGRRKRMNLGSTARLEVARTEVLNHSKEVYYGHHFTGSQTPSLSTIVLQTVCPRGYRIEIVSIMFLYCMAMAILFVALFT